MKPDSLLFPFVVADIGGTNARFGLAQRLDKLTGRLCIENQKVFPCSDFESLQAVMHEYLSDLPE